MKKFLFASVIAMVAIFATSCKDKNAAGDAPKARFSYEASGLTVQFTNMTKDAKEFAWDFGDGEKSTLENPEHTYADYGTYTVKLTVKNDAGSNSIEDNVVLTKQSVEIKVDGKFDDWYAVPANLLATAAIEDEEDSEGLFMIKFCSDASFIYFYVEYDAAEEVDILNMLIDMDDDPLTGYAAYFWSDAGTEVLLQGSISEGYENCPIYKFAEGVPQDAWDGNWIDTEAANAISVSEVKDLGKNHMAIEGAIRRSYLPNPNPKVFQVGVYVDTADWVELGALPAATPDEETGEPVYPSLLNVPLND